MQVKTNDVTAKEWFDKVAGNSYFSVRITVNYQMNDEITHALPFQLGYGGQYEYEALDKLCNEGYFTSYGSLWQTCRENNIILRTNSLGKCLKKEVKNCGK